MDTATVVPVVTVSDAMHAECAPATVDAIARAIRVVPPGAAAAAAAAGGGQDAQPITIVLRNADLRDPFFWKNLAVALHDSVTKEPDNHRLYVFNEEGGTNVYPAVLAALLAVHATLNCLLECVIVQDLQSFGSKAMPYRRLARAAGGLTPEAVRCLTLHMQSVADTIR